MVAEPIFNILWFPHRSAFQSLAIGHGTERSGTTIVCQSDILQPERILVVAQHGLLQRGSH